MYRIRDTWWINCGPNVTKHQFTQVKQLDQVLFFGEYNLLYFAYLLIVIIYISDGTFLINWVLLITIFFEKIPQKCMNI